MLAGWARGLLALDEAALVRIAFRDEPLRGKLTSVSYTHLRAHET